MQESCITCYILLYKLHKGTGFFSLFFVHIDNRCIELCKSAQVRANLCTNLCRASKPYVLYVSEITAQVAQVFFDILFPGDLCSRWYIGKKVCNLCRYLPYLVQMPAAQGFAGCTGSCTGVVCVTFSGFLSCFPIIGTVLPSLGFHFVG